MSDLDFMPVIPKHMLEVGQLYFCDADSFIFGEWKGEYFSSYVTVNVEPIEIIEYYIDDVDPKGNFGTVRPFTKATKEE